MSPILEAAFQLQAFCAARSWRFCFIGGIVIARWGEPRTTADADLTLLTPLLELKGTPEAATRLRRMLHGSPAAPA